MNRLIESAKPFHLAYALWFAHARGLRAKAFALYWFANNMLHCGIDCDSCCPACGLITISKVTCSDVRLKEICCELHDLSDGSPI